MTESALTVLGPSPAAGSRCETSVGLFGVRVRWQSDGFDEGCKYRLMSNSSTVVIMSFKGSSQHHRELNRR
jgi:hypothetical protein